jgi:hypothetical protein
MYNILYFLLNLLNFTMHGIVEYAGLAKLHLGYYIWYFKYIWKLNFKSVFKIDHLCNVFFLLLQKTDTLFHWKQQTKVYIETKPTRDKSLASGWGCKRRDRLP